MKQLPETEFPLVIRTDFSDDAFWKNVVQTLQDELEYAPLEFINDIEYSNLTADELVKIVPENYDHTFAVFFDKTTVSSAEITLLLVDLFDEPGRVFRSIVTEVPHIAANLHISNMDYFEFADTVDDDGIYRGFN